MSGDSTGGFLYAFFANANQGYTDRFGNYVVKYSWNQLRNPIFNVGIKCVLKIGKVTLTAERRALLTADAHYQLATGDEKFTKECVLKIRGYQSKYPNEKVHMVWTKFFPTNVANAEQLLLKAMRDQGYDMTTRVMDTSTSEMTTERVPSSTYGTEFIDGSVGDVTAVADQVFGDTAYTAGSGDSKSKSDSNNNDGDDDESSVGNSDGSDDDDANSSDDNDGGDGSDSEISSSRAEHIQSMSCFFFFFFSFLFFIVSFSFLLFFFSSFFLFFFFFFKLIIFFSQPLCKLSFHFIQDQLVPFGSRQVTRKPGVHYERVNGM